MISVKCIALLLVLLFSLGCQQPKNENQRIVSAQADEARSTELFHVTYVSSADLKSPKLVLVLHGDAPFSKPSYQYSIAEKIAHENSNVVSVGILRPGYTDNEGNQSKGARGNATGDNYTTEVLASIHALTLELQEKYNASKILLVGHSGGGAISANLISEYPGTYSNAVLISCPCDLQAWRAHMKELQSDAPIWNMEVNSLSPLEHIENIDDSTQITLVHGDKDEIVPIDIALKYARALKLNHKKVNFLTLKEQGHEVALNDKVFELINKLLVK